MTTTNTAGTVSAEKFGALCNLFHTIWCDHDYVARDLGVLTAAYAGDVMYYGANNMVCDESRMLARSVLAYLGLRTDVPEADQLIADVNAEMRLGEGSIARACGEENDDGATSTEKEITEMDIDLLLANPDVVITEEDAIAEGAIREMGAWGIATFRGDPVRTVSEALFWALKNAFTLGATGGLAFTDQDLADTVRALEEESSDPDNAFMLGYVAWLKTQDSCDGLIHLVPFWANLGELLQVFIEDAADTAGEGEPQGGLYATPPVKALGGRPVWLQRPKAGEWTAFLPEDH